MVFPLVHTPLPKYLVLVFTCSLLKPVLADPRCINSAGQGIEMLFLLCELNATLTASSFSGISIQVQASQNLLGDTTCTAMHSFPGREFQVADATCDQNS